MTDRKIPLEMALDDVDDEGSLIVCARYHHPEDQVRIRVNTIAETASFVDLAIADAHKLRQWLTDWLRDKPQPGYTDEDVTRLVEAAKEWRKSWAGSNYQLGAISQHLYDAISPFLTLSDPDKELIEKMIQADSASAYTNSAVDTMRAILAVVREHDKEQPK